MLRVDVLAGAVLVQIIVNPASGRHSDARILALVGAFDALGAATVVTRTGGVPPAILDDAERVVVVGGDGTVRHVAHALSALAAPPPLAVFPAGTVNLLAREWGATPSVAAFAARVVTRDARARFAIGCEGGSFLCCAGAGWESVAVATASPRLKAVIGRLAYAVAAAARLATWKPPAITLLADERAIRCQGFHVAKGTHYAGPWRMADRRLAHEPVMQVVVLRRARRRDLVRFWWTLIVGRPVAALPHVEVVECATLVASAGSALPVQADGDLVGVLPMTFRVADRALMFC